MRMLKLSLTNVCVLSPLMNLHTIYTEGATPLFRLDELPSLWKFYIQYWWMIIIEDLCFYWAHRFFHTKWIYPHIHKVHHESKQTIAISAVGTHAVEYVLGNLIPVGMGIMLMPGYIHITTFALYVVIRV